MNFFRELVHFVRFFRAPKTVNKQILFYAEHGGYFPNLEGLIEELTTVHKRTVSYVTSEASDPILAKPPPGVKPFYIRHLLSIFMLLVRSRVFVMTLTDLNQFHLKRSIHPVHYVYVFHSLVSTHMMYRQGAFDHYDSILCVGEHHVAELTAYEQQHQLPGKKLIRAGYYRLERIHARYQKYGQEHRDRPERPTILVAPSWGENNLLAKCGEPLIASLLGADYQVVVRPHPETVRREPGLLKHLEQTFGGHDSFMLERSVATDESLLKADLMICDCSGVALEYALGTERPVLYVDLPPKIQNSDYQALGLEPLELALREKTGLLVSPDELDSVPRLVEKLLGQRDDYQKELARLRAEVVFCFGPSSKRGADHIVEIAEAAVADDQPAGDH